MGSYKPYSTPKASTLGGRHGDRRLRVGGNIHTQSTAVTRCYNWSQHKSCPYLSNPYSYSHADLFSHLCHKHRWISMEKGVLHRYKSAWTRVLRSHEMTRHLRDLKCKQTLMTMQTAPILFSSMIFMIGTIRLIDGGDLKWKLTTQPLYPKSPNPNPNHNPYSNANPDPNSNPKPDPNSNPTWFLLKDESRC